MQNDAPYLRIESASASTALSCFPHDETLEAIASAMRWLKSLGRNDLAGDDAVGWWLLIEHGRWLPLAVSKVMDEQLHNLLPRIELGKSSTYTAITLIRTLARANRLSSRKTTLNTLIRHIEQFADSLSAPNPGDSSQRDLLWIIQTIYELGASGSVKALQSFPTLKRFLFRCDLWSQLLVLPFLNAALTNSEWLVTKRRLRRQILPKIDLIRRDPRLHWEKSYLLPACRLLGLPNQAEQVARYLVSVQKHSQWDEETDENIESTALVALALGEHWKLFGESLAFHRCQVLTLALGALLDGKESLEFQWQSLNAVPRQKRGRAFESLISAYCATDENLGVDRCNFRTESEELDLVLINHAKTPFLQQLQSNRIIIECKFRSGKTTAAEVRDFCGKILNRPRLIAKVGVLISVSGFTSDAETEIMRSNTRDHGLLIGLIDGDSLEHAIIEAISFSKLLEQSLSATAFK